MELGARRGQQVNPAEFAQAEKARDRRLLRKVLTGEIVVVERYDAETGLVDVKRRFDPHSATVYNVPVLWGKRKWPLEKGDMGFLHHTHDDSTGGFNKRDRVLPETPGYHARLSPVFNPASGIILTDDAQAQWDPDSLPTDYETWGPDDEIIELTGGGYIIAKSGGDITICPGGTGKVRVCRDDQLVEVGVPQYLVVTITNGEDLIVGSGNGASYGPLFISGKGNSGGFDFVATSDSPYRRTYMPRPGRLASLHVRAARTNSPTGNIVLTVYKNNVSVGSLTWTPADTSDEVTKHLTIGTDFVADDHFRVVWDTPAGTQQYMDILEWTVGVIWK